MNYNSTLSQLVQFVYGRVLNPSYKTRLDVLQTNFCVKLSKAILEFSDPLVQYNIGGFDLLIPFSHALPIFFKKHPLYSLNLSRIAKYVHQKYHNLCLIDIGANIGDSVAILRKEAKFPILCIEGDDIFFSILEKNAALFSDVYTVKSFVGKTNQKIEGSSVKDSGGSAYLTRDTGSENTIEIKNLPNILDSYPSFLESKMLKIDTDGFDCEIIRGSSDFLLKAKPIVFFEYSPFLLSQQGDDGLSIFSYLKNHDYFDLLIYDNLGYLLLSTTTDNLGLLEDVHLYFLSKKLERYCDICAFHKEDTELFNFIKHEEINLLKSL